ncbi:MAG: hypothetical protein Q8O89_08470 [Nanoarchaeota archaeon]|nr:hypothetical protein [Nanoarchaeota archaeon]
MRTSYMLLIFAVISVFVISGCNDTAKILENKSVMNGPEIVSIINETTIPQNSIETNETKEIINEVSINKTYCTQMMIGVGHAKIIDVGGRRLYVRIKKVNKDNTVNVEVSGWYKDNMAFGETTTLTFTKVYLVEMFDTFLSEPNVVKVYAGPEGCVVINETEELDLKFLNTTVEEAKMCSVDEDCIKVEEGCGCGSVGGAVAINKNYEEFWHYEFPRIGVCVALYAPQASCFLAPKCVNNRCELGNETSIDRNIQKILTAGDASTVDVEGTQAVINLISVDLNNNSIIISVNSETKQMIVNETATFGAIKVYVKQIFAYTVPSRQGAAELFISSVYSSNSNTTEPANQAKFNDCWKEKTEEINGTDSIIGKGNITVPYLGVQYPIEYLGYLDSLNKSLIKVNDIQMALEEGKTINIEGTNIRFDKILRNSSPEFTSMEIFSSHNKTTTKDCTVKLNNVDVVIVDLNESSIISQSLNGEKISFIGISADGLDATLRIKDKNVTLTFGSSTTLYDVNIYLRDIFMNQAELFISEKDNEINLSEKCACPRTKNIDCQPVIAKEKQVYCFNQCRVWWQQNCPDLQFSS